MSLIRLENRLLVMSEPVGVAAYDFDFELYFTCSHPYALDGEERCVSRVGAIADYAAVFEERLGQGLRLVNTPAEHARASDLEHWYPLIEDLTPRSRVFEALPGVGEIEREFSWPIFLKGASHTSRHDPTLSVIENAAQYEAVTRRYPANSILHWQKPVIREFVPLVPVPGVVPGKVRPSLEYRSFWWHGACVGWGRYWQVVAPYHCGDAKDGLTVAAQAAARVAVPFLVVDFAKTVDGRWIVIECNDAQESGHAGIAPQPLWRAVLDRL